MREFEPGDTVRIVGPAGSSGRNTAFVGMVGTIVEMEESGRKNIERFTTEPAQRVRLDGKEGTIAWFLEKNLALKTAEDIKHEFLELLSDA